MALADDGSTCRIERGLDGEAALRLGLAVAGVLIALRFILAARADLSEDEAYYWLWSGALAPGYYDHPPMVALWIRAGTTLFGDTAFGVRFVGLVSTILGSYFLWQASFSLFRDRTAAWLCVLWMNATLLCNAAAIIATPDTPLALFATAALFSLAKLIETGRGVWWLAIGASLGLAFDSKYTAVLLLPGLGLWLLASKEGRHWLRRPEPYIGALIAIAVTSPVFWWNYIHDWASFAKQAQHSIKDKPANAFLSVVEFFGGQAGLATPVIFLFCLFGSAYALVRGAKRSEASWLLLGAMTAPVFVFFFVHAANQKIQPNWPGFVYPAAILAAVHSFRTVSTKSDVPRWVRAAFRLAPWVGMAFTFVVFAQLGFGLLPLLAKKDPTSRLKGWSQLGQDIERLRKDAGAGLVLTDRYAITGELAFYGRGADAVAQIDERIRYSSLAEPDEAKLREAPALLVLRKDADPSAAAFAFTDSHKIATVTREAAFNPFDSYDVYLASGYRGGLFACGALTKQGRECKQQ